MRMAIVDDYAFPPDVTEAYIKAPRTEEKHASDYILKGRWKDHTPPPMPEKKQLAKHQRRNHMYNHCVYAIRIHYWVHA